MRREIVPAATQEMFKQLAASMRGTVPIEYSENFPHLNPEDGELIKAVESDASTTAGPERDEMRARAARFSPAQLELPLRD